MSLACYLLVRGPWHNREGALIHHKHHRGAGASGSTVHSLTVMISHHFISIPAAAFSFSPSSRTLSHGFSCFFFLSSSSPLCIMVSRLIALVIVLTLQIPKFPGSTNQKRHFQKMQTRKLLWASPTQTQTLPHKRPRKTRKKEKTFQYISICVETEPNMNLHSAQ